MSMTSMTSMTRRQRREAERAAQAQREADSYQSHQSHDSYDSHAVPRAGVREQSRRRAAARTSAHADASGATRPASRANAAQERSGRRPEAGSAGPTVPPVPATGRARRATSRASSASSDSAVSPTSATSAASSASWASPASSAPAAPSASVVSAEPPASMVVQPDWTGSPSSPVGGHPGPGGRSSEHAVRSAGPVSPFSAPAASPASPPGGFPVAPSESDEAPPAPSADVTAWDDIISSPEPSRGRRPFRSRAGARPRRGSKSRSKDSAGTRPQDTGSTGNVTGNVTGNLGNAAQSDPAPAAPAAPPHVPAAPAAPAASAVPATHADPRVAVAHGARRFQRILPLPKGLAFIILAFTGGKGNLNFCPAITEIQFKRNHSITGLLQLLSQPVNLSTMQQQFTAAASSMIRPCTIPVFGNVNTFKPHFITVHLAEAISNGGATVTQRLHLSAH